MCFGVLTFTEFPVFPDSSRTFWLEELTDCEDVTIDKTKLHKYFVLKEKQTFTTFCSVELYLQCAFTAWRSGKKKHRDNLPCSLCDKYTETSFS